MAYEAGTAVLEVVPSFKGIEQLLARGARDIAKGLDKALGNQLGNAMEKASSRSEKASERAGRKLGSVFAERAIKQVETALGNIPQADRVLKPLRQELEALSKIDLGKGFDERDFIKRLEKVQDALRRAQRDAQGINAVGRYTNAGNAAEALGAARQMIDAARQRGFEAGDAWVNAFQARLRAMRTALPDLKIREGSGADERQAAVIRARVQAAQALKVGEAATRDNNPLNLPIGVKISREDLARELSTIEGLLDNFVERFQSSELVFPVDKARQQVGAFFDEVKTQAQKAAEAEAAEYLKAWEDAHREQAKRDRQTQAEYAKLFDQALEQQIKQEKAARDEIARAHDDAIKEDFLRQKKAQEELNKLYEQARAEDFKRQKKSLEDLQRAHSEALQENARRRAEILRGTTAGEANQGVRKAAEAIQEVPVHLQTRAIDREMAAIRDRIAALGDIDIGVHMKSSEFADEVEREFRRLRQIARDQTVEVKVRTDASRAATELGGILVLLNRIDRDKATVDIDTSGASAGILDMASNLSLSLGRLGALIAVGASLGTAIVPAAAAATSTIGALGTAALAAGTGIGVMLLGFSGIGEAVKSMGQLAEDQQKSNVSLSRSNNQVAGALDQVKSAEMALANTRRTNQQAALKAARAIRNALEDQKDTVREVARANQDAVERYNDARRDTTRADLEAERAQLSLTEAYAAAKRAIEDLNSAVRGNALDQRQAALDIAEAKEKLDKALSNPRATEAEREQARITYEQRKLQMDDLKRKGSELSDEQEKRFATGIKGSEEVRQAEEGIAAANERARDAQRALQRAELDVSRTREEGQRKIRDAAQRVADAQQAAAEQQKAAAYSMYTANQSLISAQRALAGAYDRSSVAGGAAMDNVATAMGKLSPTAQKFARYIFGLRDAFYALRRAADPMLAGVQKAMENLIGTTSQDAIKNLQPLFGFVNRVATALGGIFVRFANTLKGPTFTRFFGYVSETAVPALNDMYTAFENILLGVTNLFLAFTPLSEDVSGGFVDMTRRFREWSEGLETNKGFQNFLNYLRDSGPRVAELIRQMAESIGKLAVAAAPVGTEVIKGFTQLFKLLNKIPEKTLISLVAGISAAAAAIAVFAGVTALATLGIPGAIAAAVAALVIGFSTLVGSSEGLREALKNAWEAIKTGISAAWGVIWPVLKQLGQLFVDLWVQAIPVFKQIGGMFLWLWNEVIAPAARGIWTVILQLWDTIRPIFELIIAIIKPIGQVIWWLLRYVIIPVVAAIVFALVKTLTPVIKFLWQYIIQPILKSIGLAFSIVAALIKVAVGVILIVLKALGMTFQALYTKYLKPAWDWMVKNVFKPMGDWFSKNIAPKWKTGLKGLSDAWGGFIKLLKTPVKFFVETLLNDGLLKGYNWLADWFDIEPKNVKIPAPKGGWNAAYATGGAVRGPGTGTSDSIPARLSHGEHVLTAREVRAAGGHEAIYELRKMLLAGAITPRFAKGGAVDFSDWLGDMAGAAKRKAKSVYNKAKDIFGGVAGFLQNPGKSVRAIFDALLKQLPMASSPLVQQLLKIPRKGLDAIIGKVKDLVGAVGGGATGSGVAGQWPSSPSAQRGDSGVWRQVLTVIKAGPKQGSFGNAYRPGDPKWHGSGRAVDWMGYNMDALATYLAARKPLELIHRTKSRDYAYTRGKDKGSFNQALMNAHKNHIHIAFDRGGLLPDTRSMPGGVMQVFHGRRTPDKVLTDTQWQNMAALANKARQSMRGGDTYNFPYRNSTLDKAELDRFFARRDALERVSRANF